MKLALLSDIHGNAPALRAALRAAADEHVEQLLIAGDFVGYYHEPGQVMELLSHWRWLGVRGNHEEMLQDWISGRDRDAIRLRYGSGIDIAATELNVGQIEVLLNLPARRTEIICDRKVLLCHGSPWDPNEYVYPDAAIETRRRLFEERQDLILFGHTHYPVLWEQGGTVAVNPGSVGQPRDRHPGAQWALWDTDAHSVSLRRESYDATEVISQAALRDPDLPFLRDVLVRKA